MVNATNYGETLTFDLFAMFNTTGGVKCPITNISIAFEQEIVPVNNSLRFSLGYDDVAIQTVPNIETYFSELFAFSNVTVDASQIIVDTSLVNLTTPVIISMNVTAITSGGILQNQTLEFDFYGAQIDQLNTLPVANHTFADLVLDVNMYDLPKETYS